MRASSGLTLLPLAVAALAAALPAQAQEPPPLTTIAVHLGDSPAAGVGVSTLVAGTRSRIGETGSQGSATFDLAALDIGAPVPTGMETRVLVERCDPRLEVLLAPSTDPLPETAEGCARMAAGSFRWNEDRAFTVYVSDGQASLIPGLEPVSRPAVRTGPRRAELFVAGSFARHTNLESTAGEGATAVDVDPGAFGVAIGLRWFLFGPRWFLDLHGRYTPIAPIRQEFGPVSNTVDMDVRELGAAAGYALPVGSRLRLRLEAGISLLSNTADVETVFADGTVRTEDRSESGLRTSLGAGLSWDVGGTWGVDVSARGQLGKGDDADSRFVADLGAYVGLW